ncbi:hypothetical protein K470DRAFT_158710 [Piedraia hortae CBS 480.64]|uniref:Uncharacterized protein n=1 Tax=Piedraia hortae CBS 480.64 TaxID=1314780 RepID=A0A6A7BRC8_9PEZI|nr:hypothetical protein K470DRAFT_158710 [Piedraia hortae CBS 480.64]
MIVVIYHRVSQWIMPHPQPKTAHPKLRVGDHQLIFERRASYWFVLYVQSSMMMSCQFNPVRWHRCHTAAQIFALLSFPPKGSLPSPAVPPPRICGGMFLSSWDKPVGGELVKISSSRVGGDSDQVEDVQGRNLSVGWFGELGIFEAESITRLLSRRMMEFHRS